MFLNQRLRRERQIFASQFEESGSQVVFRKNLRGAGVLVTPQERDACIAEFEKRQRAAEWAVVPTTVLVCAATVPLVLFRPEPVWMWIWICVLTVAVVAPLYAYMQRVWTAPVEHLASRPPAAAAPPPRQGGFGKRLSR